MRKWLPAPVILSLAALAAAAAACADTTAPPRLAGIFVLDSVDGKAAPLLIGEHVSSNGSRVILTIVYDSLYFGGDSLVERAQVVKEERFRADGTPLRPDVVTWIYPGKFRRTEERVVVTWHQVFSPVAADTFRVRGDRLVKRDLVGIRCAECPDLRHAEFVYTQQ